VSDAATLLQAAPDTYAVDDGAHGGDDDIRPIELDRMRGVGDDEVLAVLGYGAPASAVCQRVMLGTSTSAEAGCASALAARC
jgi:hypothetical protein